MTAVVFSNQHLHNFGRTLILHPDTILSDHHNCVTAVISEDLVMFLLLVIGSVQPFQAAKENC